MYTNAAFGTDESVLFIEVYIQVYIGAFIGRFHCIHVHLYSEQHIILKANNFIILRSSAGESESYLHGNKMVGVSIGTCSSASRGGACQVT